ncbi:pantoate--beta-alanine ligase [Sphingomonas sp.]
MQTVRDLATLRQTIAGLRGNGERLALVPTMGALHDGHMALVEAARRRADRVVVSIFVNPMQFAAGEDLDRYPRREQADVRMLADAGVDLIWMPDAAVMYPDGFATSIRVAGVSEGLDGAARPGHFDGVATVVAKLFHQVRPDVALFGEKDFQQLAVIRRLVADLDMDIDIVGVPTQREDDGLALSSRNIYLDEGERQAAVTLPRALGIATRAIESGQTVDAALAQASEMLVAAGFAVDYVALVDAETLGRPRPGHDRRLLAAARIGATRLIDNVAVRAEQQG